MLPRKARLGISACLMGAEVRHNGGHKLSRLCTQELARHFDFQPVCPELAIGLPVPRETIRLVGDARQPRAVKTRDPDQDLTEALTAHGLHMAEQMRGINGFIFMQQSPSCGLERVKVHQPGRPPEPGRGIFAAAFCAAHPDLPVEEEGRLHDPVLRDNFITRVYIHAQWQQLLAKGLSRAALTAFHARSKYLLMATDPVSYKRLGRLLGDMARHDLDSLAPRYFSELMRALGQRATRGTHSNVLQHLAGYLKRALSPTEKQEMQRLIGQYRTGVVPLVVPLTLLKHHFSNHPNRYIAGQHYLQPHPEDLGLRNAI